jgi:hypothetical protein
MSKPDYVISVDLFGLNQLSLKELCIVALVMSILFCGLLGFMGSRARQQCAEFGGAYCETTPERSEE